MASQQPGLTVNPSALLCAQVRQGIAAVRETARTKPSLQQHVSRNKQLSVQPAAQATADVKSSSCCTDARVPSQSGQPIPKATRQMRAAPRTQGSHVPWRELPPEQVAAKVAAAAARHKAMAAIMTPEQQEHERKYVAMGFGATGCPTQQQQQHAFAHIWVVCKYSSYVIVGVRSSDSDLLLAGNFFFAKPHHHCHTRVETVHKQTCQQRWQV